LQGAPLSGHVAQNVHHDRIGHAVHAEIVEAVCRKAL
jgi:hypothetical protein